MCILGASLISLAFFLITLKRNYMGIVLVSVMQEEERNTFLFFISPLRKHVEWPLIILCSLLLCSTQSIQGGSSAWSLGYVILSHLIIWHLDKQRLYFSGNPTSYHPLLRYLFFLSLGPTQELQTHEDRQWKIHSHEPRSSKQTYARRF